MAVSTPGVQLGIAPPDFQLPGVDGQIHSLADYKSGPALVIMFICNHCPYVKAIEDRLIQLATDLKALKVPVVAICSNDPVDYPEDSFEQMKIRSQTKGYPFPYLQDLSQELAKAYGAVCTPDFFVYGSDFKLAYRGRLDDSWKDPHLVTKRELLGAVESLIKKDLRNAYLTQQSPSMGCSIKWKKS